MVDADPGIEPKVPQEIDTETIEAIGDFAQYHPLTLEEIICQFFINQIRYQSKEWLLKEFDNLFILGGAISEDVVRQSLDAILLRDEKEVFLHTIKRCCYILINNWKHLRNYEYCQRLINCIDGVKNNILASSSPKEKTRIKWLREFSKGSHYEQIKLFVAKYKEELFSTAATIQPPLQESGVKPNSPEPSILHFVNKYLNAEEINVYSKFAVEFQQEVQGSLLKEVKDKLYQYLVFGIERQNLYYSLDTKFLYMINFIYHGNEEKIWDDRLCLRICNKMIEMMITTNEGCPASMFMCLLTQGRLNVWAVLLLKLILISPNSHKSLDSALKRLLNYYQNCEQFNFNWLNQVIEALRVHLIVQTYDLQKQLRGEQS